MTKIASHRGGTHLWPENSRLAFRQTAAMPVELVEFDVHQTSDGVLVVHHDSTIDRMTDGKGAVGSLTHEQLSRFVIIGAGGETIPTLLEVIDIFRPSPVDLRLELKVQPDGRAYQGMEQAVVDMLLETDMLGRSMITSFSLERLAAFQTVLDARGISASELLGLVWLCSPSVLLQTGRAGARGAMSAYGITEIGIRAEMISPEIVEPFRKAGMVVHGWAAHDATQASKMFELGIASFTTDRPDIALSVKPVGRV
jgi:glycerophosphoryl diester phosphodiesterase